MEGLDVVDPEEHVPGAALPLVRGYQARLRHPAEHERNAAPAVDGKLGRAAGRVLTIEPEHVAIVRANGGHVAHWKVRGTSNDVRSTSLRHCTLLEPRSTPIHESGSAVSRHLAPDFCASCDRDCWRRAGSSAGSDPGLTPISGVG